MSKVKNPRFKLLPYTKIDCLSMLDAQQKSGWGITAFDLPNAWKFSQGENVKIAVLDTGVDRDHPDLRDNLLEGINFINRSRSPDDDNGHGTHVTGILVAANNEIGMVGVCPKAQVVPVKVLDRHGAGGLQPIVDGIRWAVDYGVDFIQMSLGCPNKVQAVRKALQYAASRGVVTFCAAGNAGNTSEVFYPANYPETIAIGAIKENFERADFSNTGRNLDFMAPGADIFSTFPDKWYATLSGTSMACPFAAGVAALVLSYVKAGKADIKLGSVDAYIQLFQNYTTPITSQILNDPMFYQGFGIIDPRKLAALNMSPPIPPVAP